MHVPAYPNFSPLCMEMRSEIHSCLDLISDGISEFTFSGLYLFKNRYQYRVTRLEDSTLIISGVSPLDNKAFFMSPCGYPGDEILKQLFKTHDYWKNIPPSFPESMINNMPFIQYMETLGISVIEDPDNFDYLYLRSELAELSGKKFHKKKNHVNAFVRAWPDHKGLALEAALIPDAMTVLEGWKNDKGEDIDYFAAKEALEQFSALQLKGALYYAGNKPIAFCLGENAALGTMFVVHIEKALESYRGVYQYMNQAFAASLPENFKFINREQDLGNEGLRQAKMTYRPSGFVRKYTGAIR